MRFSSLFSAALFLSLGCLLMPSEPQASTMTQVQCPPGYGMRMPTDDTPFSAKNCFFIDDAMRKKLEEEEKRDSKTMACPEGYAFQDTSTVSEDALKEDKDAAPQSITGKCIALSALPKTQAITCPEGYGLRAAPKAVTKEGEPTKEIKSDISSLQALRCVKN